MRLVVSALALLLAGTLPARAAMQDWPAVQLRALDKSTARTTTFEVKVGATIQYGSLYIKVQSCRKSEPIDKPESAAFLQVWELPPEQQDSRWVFSGWMFASSPALSAMDHPVYDVWVLGCTGREEPVEEVTPEETEGEAGAEATAPEPEVSETDAPASDAVVTDQPLEAQENQPVSGEEEPLLD